LYGIIFVRSKLLKRGLARYVAVVKKKITTYVPQNEPTLLSLSLKSTHGGILCFFVVDIYHRLESVGLLTHIYHQHILIRKGWANILLKNPSRGLSVIFWSVAWGLTYFFVSFIFQRVSYPYLVLIESHIIIITIHHFSTKPLEDSISLTALTHVFSEKNRDSKQFV
jgi:hypothetical protein